MGDFSKPGGAEKDAFQGKGVFVREKDVTRRLKQKVVGVYYLRLAIRNGSPWENAFEDSRVYSRDFGLFMRRVVHREEWKRRTQRSLQ